MTQQDYRHPIAPPPELVQQWYDQAKQDPCGPINWVAVRAAQWGADQELEVCCEWLDERFRRDPFFSKAFRDMRRPKPPSAVAQAEALIERYEDGWCPSPAQWHVIREGLAEGRRGLEQLDD